MIKIGIHHTKGSYSDTWINYCKMHGIDYKIINCYDTNIIDQVQDCDLLMWHWFHADPRVFLLAKQLVNSFEKMGKRVYPISDSCWHYDDKVGQKYLLEAVHAPLVPSYVFYDKNKAINWAETAEFPMVFKLRGGYGSNNVKLVHNKADALNLIHTAFGRGFPQVDKKTLLQERIVQFRKNRSRHTFVALLKGIGRLFVKREIEKILGREFGYVYFQEFLPDNGYDTRLIVVGDRCFGFRRHNRPNDFRASGSGLVDYNPELFDKEAIRVAFEISKKLKAQSLAFDFIYDSENKGRIVEISYCFGVKASNKCPGHWNRALEWIEGNLNIQECIIEDFLDQQKEIIKS